MTQDDRKPANANLTRRHLLQAGIAGAGLIAGAGSEILRPGPAQAGDFWQKEPDPPYVPRPDLPVYDFKVQRTTLNPDGQKPMPGITVNGVMPGPEIRVKRGEQLRIRTANRLTDQPTSIHWHGLLVPAAMDGVPDVSNVPTAAGEMYVYEYPIRQTGSYWYHSHYGLQEQIGLFGALYH